MLIHEGLPHFTLSKDYQWLMALIPTLTAFQLFGHRQTVLIAHAARGYHDQ